MSKSDTKDSGNSKSDLEALKKIMQKRGAEKIALEKMLDKIEKAKSKK